MKKKLLMSISSLVAVLVIGAGVTYALLTSNTATISATTLTTGTATIKLCKNTGANDWRNSVSGFTVGGLVPGVEKEVTAGEVVYIGNDDGALDTAFGTSVCDSYSDAAGTSDVDMKMVPSVSITSCSDPSLEDDISLRFEIGLTDSGYGSLSFWAAPNTTPYGDTVVINGTQLVKIFATLDLTSEIAGGTCTFDTNFSGEQV